MNAYVERVLKSVKENNASMPEFIQTVEEVLTSLEPVIAQHPEYEKNAILERMTTPDRMVEFRVTWCDDQGMPHVNRGWRVQFNGVIGPYKGGLRFSPKVTEGTVKFLGFEQVLKNSLTTLPMGGAKGGSDFDPKGKSDAEVMRFCQSFMTELYKYIGPDVDVPAGDQGVGGREIGYLFGQWRRCTGSFANGVLTGKGMSYGGSLIRPEATGYGAVYYLVEMLKHFGEDVKGKTVAVSGYGNVTWGAIKKLVELGAKPVTISGRAGYVYDEAGITTDEKIDYLLEMRAANKEGVLEEYAKKFGAKFFPDEKPWGVKADVVMPCATQNEVYMEDAKKIAANGVKYYVEVSNMPTKNDAIAYLMEQGIVVAPSKAVNAGGVAVSGLEMSQNSMRYGWTAEEVDAKLKDIMKSIYSNSVSAAERYGLGYNLVAGANIAGFEKVADAMMAQGWI
ncbi:MAG: NADP-specific glutamate dehydrogenase [Oscillospiraceae bacterium]|nr:NADP-specific glutamate dehydrogenase [Oscillospiraceae bacterium]